MRRFELYGRGIDNLNEGYRLCAEYDEPINKGDNVELRMDVKHTADVAGGRPYITKYKYSVNVDGNPYAIRKAAIDEFLLNGVLMDFVDE